MQQDYQIHIGSGNVMEIQLAVSTATAAAAASPEELLELKPQRILKESKSQEWSNYRELKALGFIGFASASPEAADRPRSSYRDQNEPDENSNGSMIVLDDRSYERRKHHHHHHHQETRIDLSKTTNLTSKSEQLSEKSSKKQHSENGKAESPKLDQFVIELRSVRVPANMKLTVHSHLLPISRAERKRLKHRQRDSTIYLPALR